MTIPSMDEQTEATGLIFVPEELATDVNMLIRDASAVDALARHRPMKRNVLNLRKQLTTTTPAAVAEKGIKTKSAPTFDKYTLTAETIAVIVPFTEDEVDDSDVDTSSLVKEDVISGLAEIFDAYTLGYNLGSPYTDSWSGNTPVGNEVPFGSSPAGDIADDINEMISKIEVQGYDCTGMISHPRVKALLRGARDKDNHPIYQEDLRTSVGVYNVYGIPFKFSRQVIASGSPLGVEILGAYCPYVVVGDRMSLEIKMLDQATLTQGGETINLAEQDMIALRFRLRKAFAIKLDDILAKVTDVPLA